MVNLVEHSGSPTEVVVLQIVVRKRREEGPELGHADRGGKSANIVTGPWSGRRSPPNAPGPFSAQTLIPA